MYSVNIRKLQRRHRRELEAIADEKAEREKKRISKPSKHLEGIFAAALALAYKAFGGRK